MTTPLQELLALGQSPWYDDLSRDLILSGELATLIRSGIRGVTDNPAIFAKALSGSSAYDPAIRTQGPGAGPSAIYEALLLADVRQAADLLRPIYEQTAGRDGFASVEVGPHLAHDTAGTLAEARRFFRSLARPNVMIKVPATLAGQHAIRQLTAEGINVNITLIFGLEQYERVMEAYLAGLQQRRRTGLPLATVASVASFFVSRVDGVVDRRLNQLLAATPDATSRHELEALLGQAAIANARLAYQRFRAKFAGPRFAALRAHGAQVQRPLWASTGVKDPAYRDVRYLEALIGPDTVTTVPPATLAAFQDHGRVTRTIDTGSGRRAGHRAHVGSPRHRPERGGGPVAGGRHPGICGRAGAPAAHHPPKTGKRLRRSGAACRRSRGPLNRTEGTHCPKKEVCDGKQDQAVRPPDPPDADCLPARAAGDRRGI